MTYRGFEIYTVNGLFYATEMVKGKPAIFRSYKSIDGLHLAIDALLAERRAEDRAENERNYRR